MFMHVRLQLTCIHMLELVLCSDRDGAQDPGSSLFVSLGCGLVD